MMALILNLMMMPPLEVPAAPVAIRAATAEVVFTGKVTAVDTEKVSVAPGPNITRTVAYTVVTIEVDKALVGVGMDTHVKVGLTTEAKGEFTLGAKAVYFLNLHPVASFLVPVPGLPAVASTAKSFTKDLETVTRATTVLADAKKALQATALEDRYFAAAVLLARYSTAPANVPKYDLEPVDKTVSQLVLETLRDADWEKVPDGLPVGEVLLAQLNLPLKNTLVLKVNTMGNVAREEYRQWLKDLKGEVLVRRVVERK